LATLEKKLANVMVVALFVVVLAVVAVFKVVEAEVVK
jgi:hypothetical protein